MEIPPLLGGKTVAAFGVHERAQPLPQPKLHFGGSLVGEGQGHNM